MTAPPLLVALTLIASPAPTDEGPRAQATPSKTEASLGEVFDVDVEASGPAGTVFVFPDEAGDDRVELRVRPASPTPGGRREGVRRYAAAAYALGEVELPPILVRYRLPGGTEGEAPTPAVKLRIASALPKDPKEQQLLDIREPVPLGVGAPFWIAAAASAALLSALVAAILRRRRRRVLPAPAPEKPPEDEAREALERLGMSGSFERGEHRDYYIVLAGIAKRYLERKLGAPVLEMTSAEMAGFLRDHPDAREFAAPLRDLTAAADRVKFARGAAEVEEAQRHLAVVRRLVDSLEARLRPAPADGAGRKVA